MRAIFSIYAVCFSLFVNVDATADTWYSPDSVDKLFGSSQKAGLANSPFDSNEEFFDEVTHAFDAVEKLIVDGEFGKARTRAKELLSTFTAAAGVSRTNPRPIVVAELSSLWPRGKEFSSLALTQQWHLADAVRNPNTASNSKGFFIDFLRGVKRSTVLYVRAAEGTETSQLRSREISLLKNLLCDAFEIEIYFAQGKSRQQIRKATESDLFEPYELIEFNREILDTALASGNLFLTEQDFLGFCANKDRHSASARDKRQLLVEDLGTNQDKSKGI